VVNAFLRQEIAREPRHLPNLAPPTQRVSSRGAIVTLLVHANTPLPAVSGDCPLGLAVPATTPGLG
jgi:hypothetical protein